MIWTEVEVFTSSAGVEPLCAALEAMGAAGFVIRDPADFEDFLAQKQGKWDYIDENLLSLREGESSVVFYLPDGEDGREKLSRLGAVLDRLRGLDEGGHWGSLRYQLSELEEESWQDSWKKHWKPTRVGKRLIVCPSWEEFNPAPGEVVISLDPGMAFGTGTHDSTRLCMELAEGLITGGEQILDLGCGSGILAITSLLLGGESAIGVDIDEVAIRACGENAAVNGLADRARFRKGNLADGITGQYDLIFANIVADIILQLAPDIPRLLAPGGALVTSGILAERAGEIESAFAAIGLTTRIKLESGGWAALMVVES
ncbi:MAG: 50S ribosomal protein L11 methyltransferase [Oscillospiraceae bacterium]|nr:50S ribosomal protein L11 methyltransferase [Oscillospiraceae bacterium]